MTWIVGANSLFGMAFLVSDIQITFSGAADVEYLDCCQKVHALSQDVIGGFAGSVKIGFAVIERLRVELQLPNANSAWELDTVVNDWLPGVVKDVYDSSEASEQLLGCQIILASAHPTRNRGAPMPWTDVVKLSWPNFVPQFAAQTGALSIGSGSSELVYAGFVNQVTAYGNTPFNQAAIGNTQNQGRFLAQSLSDLVSRHSVNGISKIFQVMDVTRNKINICNHEYDIHPPTGTVQHIRFPAVVATSYEDFLAYCDLAGAISVGAIA